MLMVDRFRRRFAPTLRCCAGVLILGAGACSSGPKNFDNENDRLRRLTLEMETQIAELEAQVAELRARAQERVRATGEEGALREEVIAALPRCADLTLDRLSGLVDTDGDGLADAADVYAQPVDGRRRFCQVSGWLTVSVSLLPPEVSSASGPLVLASQRLGPLELREAYRYGFTGIHYSVRVPLNEPIRANAGVLLIAATLEDGVTGAQHMATLTRDLRTQAP